MLEERRSVATQRYLVSALVRCWNTSKRQISRITQLQNWTDLIVMVLKDKDQLIEDLPFRSVPIPCFIRLKDDVRHTRQIALQAKRSIGFYFPKYNDKEYNVQTDTPTMSRNS